MSKENQPQQRPEADYFRQPLTPAQRQYEALRAYFLEGLPAIVVAERFGYTPATIRSLCRDFRQQRLTFFPTPKPGPKQAPKSDPVRERIIELRKRNYSI
jgi:transposase